MGINYKDRLWVDNGDGAELLDSEMILTDSDVTQPATVQAPADALGFFGPRGGTSGGMKIKGINDTGGVEGLYIQGIHGVTNPTDTVAAISLLGQKSDGATDVTALADAETVLKVFNDTSLLLTINGKGTMQIGTAAPSANADLTLNNTGALMGKEITTPSADTNYWKLYSKTDNMLYFQDGAGVEKNILTSESIHAVSFAMGSSSVGGGSSYPCGFYDDSGTNSTFSSPVTYGNTVRAVGAHAYVVADGPNPSNPPNTGDVVQELTVSGASIDDEGNYNAADSEVLFSWNPGQGAAGYYETTKKWVGDVTFTLTDNSYAVINYNYGFAKYFDNNNTDFTIKGFNATWLGGANDTSPNLIIRHHKTSGWTYNAGGAVPPTELANMQTDYTTEYQIRSGEYHAYKRDNLNTAISGSGSEGLIVELVYNNASTYKIGSLQIHHSDA